MADAMADAELPACRQLRELESSTVDWMVQNLGTAEVEARETVRRLFGESSDSSSSPIKFLRDRTEQAIALREELKAQDLARRRRRWKEEHEDELRSTKFEMTIDAIFSKVTWSQRYRRYRACFELKAASCSKVLPPETRMVPSFRAYRGWLVSSRKRG